MKDKLNYYEIEREEWRNFYKKNINPLTSQELTHIKSVNDRISLEDVQDIYMPLVHLLALKVQSHQMVQDQQADFLGIEHKKVTFILGIAGSVAVGKSTTARLLTTLLRELYPNKKIQMITTDGFLYSNKQLANLGLTEKKGFPESYDMESLINFINQVKDGKLAKAPVYSHQSYDIIPNRYDIVDSPDILIIEGINVLQLPTKQPIYVSDFFDFSIYVDAMEKDIKQWYLERFELLLDTALSDPRNHFYELAKGDRKKAIEVANDVWQKIDHVNLEEYILPTRNRADLIMRKGENHIIQKLFLRKY